MSRSERIEVERQAELRRAVAEEKGRHDALLAEENRLARRLLSLAAYESADAPGRLASGDLPLPGDEAPTELLERRLTLTRAAIEIAKRRVAEAAAEAEGESNG